MSTLTPFPTIDTDVLWALPRRSTRVEDNLLLSDTKAWIAGLPKGVSPVYLPQQYSRIANELCRVWEDSEALAAYFTSLLKDTRPQRTGFSPMIAQELKALLTYRDEREPGFAGRVTRAQ